MPANCSASLPARTFARFDGTIYNSFAIQQAEGWMLEMAGTIYSPRGRLNLSVVACLSLVALVAAEARGSESAPVAASEEAAAEPKGKQPRGRSWAKVG